VSREFLIMDNPVFQELEKLPKDTLIELINMYSHNWMTLDGLWFNGVEEKYGLDAALELDVRMWQIGSTIEATRIKNVLGLEEGGLDTIIKTINFMTWAPSFGYEYTISGNKAIWTCKHCPPQEQRVAMGKGEFACQPTFDACFNNVVKVIDPKVRVECTFCPPGPHPDDAWCQWEFILPGNM
jgi:hypothetical protein